MTVPGTGFEVDRTSGAVRTSDGRDAYEDVDIALASELWGC